MKLLTLSAVAFAVALTGCADLQKQTGLDNKTVGAAGGAAIGCVGGALLAKITGQNAAAGCLVGAVAGGFVGFEKARQDELSAAAQAQQEAIAALGPLSSGRQINAQPIKTVEVTATDKSTNETRKYQAFDSMSIDLPLNQKDTLGYDKAIASLRTYAEKLADDRGSSKVDRTMTSADARAQKYTLDSNVFKTAKGNPVTVSKTTDNTLQKGIERVTVRAGKLERSVVS